MTAIVLFILLFVPAVIAADMQVWQGQYYKGTQFQVGTFDFNLTVYDASTGGNACYSTLTSLTTGNFGEWRTEQSGIGAVCNNASQDYYLEITINNEIQTPRRLLKSFDFLRKDIDEETSASLKAKKITSEEEVRVVETFFVKAGETIRKGQPVYIHNFSNLLRVVKVSNRSDFTTIDVIGIASEDGIEGQEIRVHSHGFLNDINTSGFSPRDKLYVGNKKLTNVASERFEANVEVGLVFSAHETNGSIFIDLRRNSVVINKNSTSSFSVVNLNNGSRASSSMAAFNDVGNRAILGITSSGTDSVIGKGERVVLSNDGTGSMFFENVKTADFIWRNFNLNITPAVGQPPTLDILNLMNLSHDGQLQLLQNGIKITTNVSNNVITRFIINKNGSVGVNISSPLEALHVVGNEKVEGTGFFTHLGSLASRITKLFVHDVDVSGNLSVTGNITLSGKKICLEDGTNCQSSSNISDTNESVRFNNLVNADCQAGKLVIGVQDNGTVLCVNDSVGGNHFDQVLNTTNNVQFNSINASNINLNGTLRFSGTDTYSIRTTNDNDTLRIFSGNNLGSAPNIRLFGVNSSANAGDVIIESGNNSGGAVRLRTGVTTQKNRIVIQSDGDIILPNLTGTGNDFLCIAANGRLFRSNTAC